MRISFRRITNILHSITRRQIFLAIGVLLLIAALILFLALRPKPDPMDSAEIETILDRGGVRIGVLRSSLPNC